MILLLLPVQLHDDREHKQVMPALTGPRILLAKQLYYGRTRCDSPSASSPIAFVSTSSLQPRSALNTSLYECRYGLCLYLLIHVRLIDRN